MKFFLSTIVILPFLFWGKLMSQEIASHSNPDSIYLFVDRPPEFVGGSEGLLDYYINNLSYPAKAQEAGIAGKIYIQFVVEADGTVSNEKLLRGIGGGCDEEALRVIHEMPAWNPGIQKGVPVRVLHTLPIKFSLDPTKPSQTKIFLEADSLPEFVGGNDALNEYLELRIQNYDGYIDTTIAHNVDVYFVVETDGNLSNIMVKDSIENGLDSVAINMVKNMPAWKPGKIGNTEIRMMMYVPINLTNNNSDSTILTCIESMPEFPGGMQKLMNFLGKNIKYPAKAKMKRIQGNVLVNFVVEADGSITNLKVIKGIGGGCDEEAIRVLSTMPKWNPGKQLGKPVKVSYNLPVKFSL